MPTKQETFDTVVRKLKAQGCKSLGEPDEHGQRFCRYRGEGGVACAAGCLIPDAKYDERMEGVSIAEVNETEFQRLLIELRRGDDYLEESVVIDVIESEGHDPYLVAAMQWVHDECWWNDGPFPADSFRIVANHFKLSPAVIDE